MAEGKELIDALAGLMNEYGLAEASIKRGNTSVAFRQIALQEVVGDENLSFTTMVPASTAAAEPEVPKGTPVSSPMNGIFYSAPSPTSTPFVKEGDSVTAGQVVGLIEAMKVFNEITATVSGTLLKQVAETGQVVQPGDVLYLIG